ncbi:MAG: universal stress protein [Syntrophotaleaceae bacterium]
MKRFKNILYVNEPTVGQSSTLARAFSLAEQNQADLTILDVIPPGFLERIGLSSDETVSDARRKAVFDDHRKDLESLVQSFRHSPVRLDVLVGRTFLEVIRTVLKNACDLVIKPAENPTWSQRLFGSDDLHLLRKCPCPIWLMKSPEKPDYKTILAAVDFDPLNPVGSDRDLNREILELACSLALSNFASLHLVHAWEPFAEKTTLSRAGGLGEDVGGYVEKEHAQHRQGLYKLVAELQGWIGKESYEYLAPTLHLIKGSPKKMVAQVAEELQADLVVMGTVARTGISGLIIGNTAEAILDQLRCSVLAIKPPGFQTPVRVDSGAGKEP